MADISCQLLVIGAGPGGYVCAIRAGQLGLDTVIVDDRKPGGTCLNIGCIPSKALIHAADEYFAMREAAERRAIPGLTAGEPDLDWSAVVGWKDGIVNRLNNGVTSLLKKARVKLVDGRAQFLDGKTVLVTGETGTQRITAQNIVIATGSQPVELPALPFGGKVIPRPRAPSPLRPRRSASPSSAAAISASSSARRSPRQARKSPSSRRRRRSCRSTTPISSSRCAPASTSSGST